MTELMSLLALVRLRYRTGKLCALMWALRHLMGRAERLARWRLGCRRTRLEDREGWPKSKARIAIACPKGGEDETLSWICVGDCVSCGGSAGSGPCLRQTLPNAPQRGGSQVFPTVQSTLQDLS
jgi:hypothetical protein